MNRNRTFQCVQRWKTAWRALGSAALLATAMQVATAPADAADPHLFHRLCDPRAPAEDLDQAAHCTTIVATINPDRDSSDTAGDRIWMRMSDACEIELKGGRTAAYNGDGSEMNYEFGGSVALPVTAKWTFPSGCSLQAHVRQAQGSAPVPFPGVAAIQKKDLIRYFTLNGGGITGDTVRVTLSMDDGSVSSTK